MGKPRIVIQAEDITDRDEAAKAADELIQSFERFMTTAGKMEGLLSVERAALKTFLVYGAEGSF